MILQAAQKLGLEDRVKSWGCSTPCNTDFLAKALGPKWNNKLFVNAELASPDDHNGPEMQDVQGDPRQVRLRRRRRHRLVQPDRLPARRSSWSRRCRTVHGAYTMKSVNAAIEAIKDYKTEMLCTPWTYGKLGVAHPEQRRLHDDAREREDGDGPGLHRDLRGRPADRAVPVAAKAAGINRERG